MIETLIARYGLLAILVGAGAEGEAVVLSGGILAHQRLLPFWGVAACATAGSFLADQLWFQAGRHARDRAWVRALRERSAYRRALRLLDRHRDAFILSFRFIYGLRTVSPVVIGTSDVSARRFVVLNLLAAAAWGPLLTWAGFQFGKAFDPWLHDARTLVLGVAAVILVAGCGWAAWRLIRRSRR